MANFICLQRQVKEGIDAVIVDSVLAIRKGLTGGQETAAQGGDQLREKVEEVAVSNGKGDGAVNGGEGRGSSD